MKQNLRLMGLICPKSSDYNIKLPIIILAIALFSCVQTRAQRPEPSGPVLSGKDSLITKIDTTVLEEVKINAGYYKVKDRERTGSIGRVDAQTIARQPVSNPLAALHGQIPGVEVTQLSGVPGGNIVLRIRGQNSLLNGSDPLYIVDGVPFVNGQQPLNQLTSAAGEGVNSNASAGISPLSLLNPADIASIEILKDADATAIYGSRGANGVVLITTHKGSQKSPRVNAQYRTGLSRPSRLLDMLSGTEYLNMRREAFANDGITINASNAPDLVLWDTTSVTDFASLLLPENARYTDAQLSVNGGGTTTTFLVSGSYHDESTVFNDSRANQRMGLHSSGSLRNTKGNFSVTGTVNLTSTTNNLPVYDLTRYLNASPFFRLYNDDGTLAWDNAGTSYFNLGILEANPLAWQHRMYKSRTINLTNQLTAAYEIFPGMKLKTSFGSNLVLNNEQTATPSLALDTYATTLPSASFANVKSTGWSLEPQLDYQLTLDWANLSALLGGTWQHIGRDMLLNAGSNYTSDLLLGSIAAAGDVYTNNRNSEYRYQGFYIRMNGNFFGRYILNLTGRRDGSSRFSPENRYATFAAVGAAWLIDAEPFMNWATWLDQAKLRASYGITGNDQIGDYMYVDTWSVGRHQYEGTTVLNPVSLYNPNYVWERNRKSEIGMEIRMFDNRFHVGVGYFHNLSDNQLIQYTLANQTGFTDILRNQQATILNAGWEFQLAMETRNKSPWHWHTSINVTLPRNKLLDFPGLETSSYRTRYVIGEPLTTRLGYRYLGVNEETGLYDYVDVDGNGLFNTADAIFPIRNRVRMYGGLNNTLSYKQWSLSFTLDGKVQDGYNFMRGMGTNIPGYRYANQPKLVLQRWQQPGDKTPIQRFTASTSEAYLRAMRLGTSDAVISDASYARLRNVSVSYSISPRLIKPLGLAACRVSGQAQNLLTFTNYEGSDPESQDLYVLPPLRSVVFSMELSF